MGLTKIDEINGSWIRQYTDENVFFYLSGAAVNADGSPQAYHPNKEKGLDYLANAGSPDNWWGIATGRDGRPFVQQEGSAAPGYYVSTTSLIDPDFPISDTKRYVDSGSIPFIVLPSGKSYGAKLGDIAMVLNTANGKACGAIYADVGPKNKIGEVSIYLAKELDIPPNPKNGGTSSQTIVYVVFPGSNKEWPISVDAIKQKARLLFCEWGSFAKLATAYPKLIATPNGNPRTSHLPNSIINAPASSNADPNKVAPAVTTSTQTTNKPQSMNHPISALQTIRLKNYKAQNTRGIRGLSEQCAAQTIVKGKLVKVEHPNLIENSDSLVHLYLQPEVASALLKAAAETKIIISTALRTLPQQYALKNNLPGLVANVGRSNHGGGGAIDVVNYDSVKQILRKYGFIQSYPGNDPVHFDHREAEDIRAISILSFQQLWNLNQADKLAEDGDYGRATAIALANSPISGFPNGPVGSTRSLHEGLTGKDVGQLQFDLRALGLFQGVADGVFRPGTTEAVKAFQAQKNLTVDGIAGPLTQKQIKAALPTK